MEVVMYDKVTSPKFKVFGEIMDNSNIFNNYNIYSFKNKSIGNLKFLTDDHIYIKVLSGVVMILVSTDYPNLNSFIINRPIKLKKEFTLILYQFPVTLPYIFLILYLDLIQYL